MTNHPITPPIAQMSTVRMLMGIGGVMNRFVRTRRTRPTTALMTSPINENPPLDSTARATRTTNMSTINSTQHYIPKPARPQDNDRSHYSKNLGPLPLFLLLVLVPLAYIEKTVRARGTFFGALSSE